VKVPYEALRQWVTIRRAEGSGSYGPIFGAPETVRASVQQTQALVTDWKNDQVVINTLIIVRPPPEVEFVPAGSYVITDAETFRVAKCFYIPDEKSPSHLELMVRSWGAEDIPEWEESS
jgi:hypothetical protein